MELSFHCPYCGSSNKSLRYNAVKKVHFCHRCGHAGPNLPGNIIVPSEIAKKYAKPVKRSERFLPLANVPDNRPAKKAAMDYLRSHNIDPTDRIQRLVGLDGFWLTVPIPGPKRYYMIVKRSLLEKRFFIPANKGATLYVRGRGRTVVIVESAFSVLRLQPFVRAVALLGSTISYDQVDAVRDRFQRNRVLILFDADAFDKACTCRAKLLHAGVRTQVCRLPWGDPCDWSDDSVQELLL